MTAGNLSRHERSVVGCPEFNQRLRKINRSCTIVVALSFAVLFPGCQSAQKSGLVRAWADVNSLGTPAAFIDQFRTDGFRTEAPATGLANVETIEIRAVSPEFGTMPCQQFPVFDPIIESTRSGASSTSNQENFLQGECETTLQSRDAPLLESGVESISHSAMQSERFDGVFPPLRNHPPIIPAGAWLF